MSTVASLRRARTKAASKRGRKMIRDALRNAVLSATNRP
jgi:hypothetical protein